MQVWKVEVNCTAQADVAIFCSGTGHGQLKGVVLPAASEIRIGARVNFRHNELAALILDGADARHDPRLVVKCTFRQCEDETALGDKVRECSIFCLRDKVMAICEHSCRRHHLLCLCANVNGYRSDWRRPSCHPGRLRPHRVVESSQFRFRHACMVMQACCHERFSVVVNSDVPHCNHALELWYPNFDHWRGAIAPEKHALETAGAVGRIHDLRVLFRKCANHIAGGHMQ